MIRNKNNIAIIVVAVLCLSGSGNFYDNPDSKDITPNILLDMSIDTVTSNLPFINDSLCYITDPTLTLTPFISELQKLVEGKDTVVNIIHLGDSHIQAGILSGRTMRLLHSAFGNAGRGWIAPFKLMRQNEPPDYFILSDVRNWTGARCVLRNNKCSWGIGGIGVMTDIQRINFNLVISPRNGTGYGFNSAILFRDSAAAVMEPATASIPLIADLKKGVMPVENIVADTFLTADLTDSLHLKSFTKGKSQNLYYGFMLTNGKPGVLYHSIGVNGARFIDYTNRSYIRQLSLLKPSLLIVSLGTNESYGRYFNEADFEAQVNSFVNLVREELPDVTLLITTPLEAYKRKVKNQKRYYEPNPNMKAVADVLRSYSDSNNIATLDMYSIGGGQNSCIKWFESGMFGSDHIHFTQNAYSEQGSLLYKALMRSFLNSFPNKNGEEVSSVE
ncbi:MAG: GDSL-type esterase/lipase family protein [Tannerella sp.]|jgi:lysophospholipase L1-like esterase|nr:GDSL-type esterase/lipase family protein [Tannerella sp.]